MGLKEACQEKLEPQLKNGHQGQECRPRLGWPKPMQNRMHKHLQALRPKRNRPAEAERIKDAEADAWKSQPGRSAMDSLARSVKSISPEGWEIEDQAQSFRLQEET
jgi:hypothetical protein